LLEPDERITELAAMLGADRPETRLSVEAMLALVEREKADLHPDFSG
jgi:hypothetical protein